MSQVFDGETYQHVSERPIESDNFICDQCRHRNPCRIFTKGSITSGPSPLANFHVFNLCYNCSLDHPDCQVRTFTFRHKDPIQEK